MRTLIVGALAATPVGCSCYVSPQSGTEACTGAHGRGFACLDRSVAAGRHSQATEPEPSSLDPGATTAKEKRAKLSSAHAAGKTRRAEKAAKSTTNVAAKAEPAAAAPPSDTTVPVIDRAKIAIAKRKNTLGSSADSICGHVKSKKASGKDIGGRPFLYLVKDDEAYVADGSRFGSIDDASQLLRLAGRFFENSLFL